MTVATCPECATVLWYPHEQENQACDYCKPPTDTTPTRPVAERVWWPAGLQELTPAERAQALEEGRWTNGTTIIWRSGHIEDLAA